MIEFAALCHIFIGNAKFSQAACLLYISAFDEVGVMARPCVFVGSVDLNCSTCQLLSLTPVLSESILKSCWRFFQ